MNQKVINLLDEYLFGNLSPGTPALNTYWENFYHHLDDDRRLSDVLRTYFASFGRLGTRYVSARHCQNLPVGEVKEVTYVNQDDEFRGMLVLQRVGLKGGRNIALESWLERVDQEQIMNLNMSGGPNRLTGLQVSYTTKNAQVATNLLTSCNRLVTTSRYQDAFAWLATAC